MNNSVCFLETVARVQEWEVDLEAFHCLPLIYFEFSTICVLCISLKLGGHLWYTRGQ